jgi:hypothetical protein
VLPPDVHSLRSRKPTVHFYANEAKLPLLIRACTSLFQAPLRYTIVETISRCPIHCCNVRMSMLYCKSAKRFSAESHLTYGYQNLVLVLA